ncbi:MAG: nucleotide pyrophosphohydrolase [Candidatus Kerfeldbacteria bacterium]|nr:nucleotide pyrophosphohydrolase [Candidatus Kerfeldbacteria bacterium]
MSDIEELTDQIVAFSKERDWLQFHNPKDLAESIIIEAAELLEHFQWKTKDEAIRHVKEKQVDVADELADVMIYALELAYHMKIDVRQAIEDKMKKNAVKYPVEKSRSNAKKYTELE